MISKNAQTEILKNQFKAISEEMTAVLLHTAYTVFIKETADFGCALVAPGGEVFATATDRADNCMVGLPTMTVIRALEPYAPGDIGIANDPTTTGGLSTHLPDIYLWKPIFVDDEIIAYAISYIHSSDVGGKVPGSIALSSVDVYQEGLRIPPVRLYTAGVLNESVRDIIKLNSRIPEELWGDIKAQLSGISRGETRLQAMVKRYGVDLCRQGILDVMDLAEARSRAILSRIPNGQYTFSDYLENDDPAGRHVRIQCTLRADDGNLELDFDGSDVEVANALNLPTFGHGVHYQVATPLRNLLCTLEPSIPYNSGMLRPVTIVAPPGTVVNPGPQSATGVRYATAVRVHDAILGCLSQAIPGSVPAGGPGAVAIVLVSANDPETGERRVAVAQPFLGGSGGRPGLDGVDGCTFGGGGHLHNVPNEVLEHDLPLVVERYGLLEGSAAPGEYRGGMAVEFRMRALVDDTVIATRGLERLMFQPWGRAGGRPGRSGRVVINLGRADERVIHRPDSVTINAGDTISFFTPAGGALGDPMRRDPQAVVADLAKELLDRDQAREHYAVVVDDSGAVDQRATEELRETATAGDGTDVPAFDYGPFRAEYEQRWSEDAQRVLITNVLTQPRSRRHTLQRKLNETLHRLPADHTITAQDVTAACAEHAEATEVPAERVS